MTQISISISIYKNIIEWFNWKFSNFARQSCLGVSRYRDIEQKISTNPLFNLPFENSGRTEIHGVANSRRVGGVEPWSFLATRFSASGCKNARDFGALHRSCALYAPRGRLRPPPSSRYIYRLTEKTFGTRGRRRRDVSRSRSPRGSHISHPYFRLTRGCPSARGWEGEPRVPAAVETRLEEIKRLGGTRRCEAGGVSRQVDGTPIARAYRHATGSMAVLIYDPAPSDRGHTTRDWPPSRSGARVPGFSYDRASFFRMNR